MLAFHRNIQLHVWIVHNQTNFPSSRRGHFWHRLATSLDPVIQTESQLKIGRLRRFLRLRQVIRDEPDHERSLRLENDALAGVCAVRDSVGGGRGQGVIGSDPNAAEECSPGPVGRRDGGHCVEQAHNLKAVGEKGWRRSRKVICGTARDGAEAIAAAA